MNLKQQLQKNISINDKIYKYTSLKAFSEKYHKNLTYLPFSIRILLEQMIRNFDDFKVKEADILNTADWEKTRHEDMEIPFIPARVVLQDFTGVPCLVDLASLRKYMSDKNKNPDVINPKVPVDLIIDHSVQVDVFGSKTSAEENMKIEFSRNRERYEFLKWGGQAFKNFRVFPPGAGIIHQVNLEYLATVVHENQGEIYPDTLVGTDSHTTMINGVGVLGWGVGGIEAESAMLGQPVYMKIPEVVGFKLTGKLKEGITSTDLVLTVTQILREKKVVEKFVEFYGNGLNHLSLADRATIANMAPEYGATVGFFPVDNETLRYLKGTGRDEHLIDVVLAYTKEQGLFREDNAPDPKFSEIIELDLSTVEPCLAGPKRPQDKIPLKSMKSTWHSVLSAPTAKRGFELAADKLNTTVQIPGSNDTLTHGSVVIAAITSCTNTSNPSVMVGAGLVAKKAYEKGLKVKPWVKSSLAPGSRVVTEYLNLTSLSQYLDGIGFFTVGYGCTTCIGNSGPLPENIGKAIKDGNLVAASVLSGNRNFEGRVHSDVRANFLASPLLVVVYALVGTVNVDLLTEPIGKDQNGKDVFMKDVWPTTAEIQSEVNKIKGDLFRNAYGKIETYSTEWKNVVTQNSNTYNWDENSTYIQNPPFFKTMPAIPDKISNIINARILLKLGDSITTDHISPAGAFKPETPAGKHLIEKGVKQAEFNSYGSRRGNDRVMSRGTFANIRIRNQILNNVEGGFTQYFPTGETMPVYDAAMKYAQDNTPLVVIAGAEYGTGSSRDWAAKGTFLLGIKAVIAGSFEKIHRSNLVGMGVLPLQFKDGQTAESLNITGKEIISVFGIDHLSPKKDVILKVDDRKISVICRLDTPIEIEYYKNGGTLHTVLRNFINEDSAA